MSPETVLSRVEHNWSRKGIAGHEMYDDGSQSYIRQLDALICTLGITVAGVVVAALAWWPV